MDPTTFAREVAALEVGKRLPDGVYVHTDVRPLLPAELVAAVGEACALAGLDGSAFQVVKFSTRYWKLSLLAYPRFFEEPFPCLAASWVVNLTARSVSHRAYAKDGNPPVLHRKEALLPPDHPRIPEFAALTAAAEHHGLFVDPKAIGTKRAWDGKLQRLGVCLDGHRLVESRQVVGTETATARAFPTPPVLRHRTALQRYRLSTPMQALWRHGYLDGRCTVFDYGCGRGDDVRLLRTLGVDASGWDPYFASQNEKIEADLVNLGFVINVIEDPQERRAALTGAYALARKLLTVAALIGGRTAYEQHRLLRDGVLTTRGTFQKYYSQQEMREYLETTLGREPIAVAPGVFFIFCDDGEEQRFLAARQTQARCAVALPKIEKTERPRRRSRWEVHRELLEDFWDRCITLGRLPKSTEYPRLKELRDALGTPPSVLRKLVVERGEASLQTARRARMDDLQVYLALNLFEGRKSFRRLPDSLQRDIASFWGSHAFAQRCAAELLFSVGNTEVIQAACSAAAAQGVGYLDGDHSLQFHSSFVPRLPPVLRIYVGCASRLYGEVQAADLVKIHIHSGKLSLMMYDEFTDKPLPRLIERIKINLRTQSVQFFDYSSIVSAQLLYNKSRYIPPEFSRHGEQVKFDASLIRLGIDLSGFGPDERTLLEQLQLRGTRLIGFRIVSLYTME
jgi:DNA phosphorothioation-associated putative methyltransferase